MIDATKTTTIRTSGPNSVIESSKIRYVNENKGERRYDIGKLFLVIYLNVNSSPLNTGWRNYHCIDVFNEPQKTPSK